MDSFGYMEATGPVDEAMKAKSASMRKMMMDVISGLPDSTVQSMLKTVGFDAQKIMDDAERAGLPPDQIVPWGQQKVTLLGQDNRPRLLQTKEAMINRVLPSSQRPTQQPDYMEGQDDGIQHWQPFGDGLGTGE